ncbi:hypothetical protein BV22DRAFT_1033676 [Leucogyrophana mollusca]|uniref:Uncharacterized protein n=1 Tax=Leucogyrophana mollusca TaxID=85980 RepID=A0ACB8BJU2_9AGAM|nr:hypothetical protein BV22DRAFT_1033676 [Leucogyrophana mollusca]
MQYAHALKLATALFACVLFAGVSAAPAPAPADCPPGRGGETGFVERSKACIEGADS